MKKKFLAFLTLVALMLSLTACGEQSELSISDKKDKSDKGESSYQETKYPGIWDVLPEIDVTPEEEFEYKYSIALNGIVVTDYIGEKIRVRVPDTIEGESVVKIDISDTDFASSMNVTEFIVPDTVRELNIDPANSMLIKHANYPTSGENISFSLWPALEAVYIPKGVTEISESAFSFCTVLEKVTMPDTLTKIGDSAFELDAKLADINIPDSVTEIGENAFYGCSSLTNITIPLSVSEIGEGAFHGCSGLTNITIPLSVTEIKDMTFAKCTALSDITIPDSVTEIGMGAFAKCTSLESVKIPDNVTSIGEDAFAECTSIRVSYKGKTYDGEHISDLCSAING